MAGNEQARPSTVGQPPGRRMSLLSTLAEIKHLDLAGQITHQDAKMVDWGGYGDIFTGICSLNGRGKVKVAIKRIRLHAIGDKKVDKFIGREIKLWSGLKHANILPLLGYVVDEHEFPCLISEYMSNGTVLRYSLLHPDLDVLHMVIGIAEGVHYLHSKRIIHSDLKSDNILVSEMGKPLICDFGISRMITISHSMSGKGSREQSSSPKGSCRWMSPELFIPPEGQSLKHTKEADVWAFGMTVYELLSKNRPYYKCTNYAQVIMAITVQGTLPDKPDTFDLWPAPFCDVWNLCGECWSRSLDKRPTMEEIITRLKDICFDLSSQVSGKIDLPCNLQVGFSRKDALKALLLSEKIYVHELSLLRNVQSRIQSRENVNSETCPLSDYDIRIIFNNVIELEEGAGIFLKKLKEVLGEAPDDIDAESSTGLIFLDAVSRMKPPYERYISGHPGALRHLCSLPSTAALADFLKQTQELVSSSTTSWDLRSLLLRPAQRHLKYAKLLDVIIEHTSDVHADKEYLIEARKLVEELTWNASEAESRIAPAIGPVSPEDESHSLSTPQQASLTSIAPHSLPPQSPSRSPTSTFNTLIDLYTRQETIASLPVENLESVANHRKSADSLSTALEQLTLNASIMPPTAATEIPVSDTFPPSDEKPLPVPPEDVTPLTSPAVTTLSALASEASTEDAPAPPDTTVTKRKHILKELLSSEQTYASDLAFIRDVHIPMALGIRRAFHLPMPSTPPSSLSSSSQTQSSRSTSSDPSSSSNHAVHPMTGLEARIIFMNIAELATFSETLSQRLEEALGGVLEDRNGEDCVGSLFLEILPKMEPLYMTYIIKHPNALEHLDSLPRTPALVNYLAQTQNLASSVTHALDLPSLLIKPVQRLLKYSLLLSTIIEDTPDDHEDKENLKKARDQMEELARKVNEGRRRIEAVKEVLTGKTDIGKPASLQKKLSIGKTVQVGVGRMKSIGMGLRVSRPKEGGNNEESARVAELEGQLRKCEAFVRELAECIVHWARIVRASQEHLRVWAIAFGKTIGISEKQPSEAFNAFMEVINTRLVPLCNLLDSTLKKELLPELASLLDTSKSPLRLLSAMHALEPQHNALLNLNYSKHRPTPSMLEVSQKYLALRGQLATDLPKYLELFDKGVVMCIRRFARRQEEFWSSVRDGWGALWDCFRMEGETYAGCVDTLTLWWTRYSEVEEAISKLNILKREKPFLKGVHPRASGSSDSFDTSSIDSSIPFMALLPNSLSSNLSGSSTGQHRSVRSMDSGVPRHLRTSPSSESVPTLSSSARGKSRPCTPDGPVRMKPRSNTIPLPLSSSQHSLNIYSTTYSPPDSTRDYAESVDSRDDVRGRKSRGLSLGRRLRETLRTPLRRPPSQKSVVSQRSQRSIPQSTHHANFLVLDLDDSAAPPLPIGLYPPSNSPSIYYVTVVHPCSPPEGAIYNDLPFFQLREGDVFGVLKEMGHPSRFEGLCVDVDEGEDDCLLVLKDEEGDIGLGLAGFLMPLRS